MGADLRGHLRRSRHGLPQSAPDVLFFIYNDHGTSFFFDHYSSFALGIGTEYAVADEGVARATCRPCVGHPALSAHMGAALMADEFDMSFFQHRPLDHGRFSPLSMMLPHAPGWAVGIVPLQVGVLQFPIPYGASLLSAGTSIAARHRELSRRYCGRNRRYRRAVAPGARRARPASGPNGTREFMDLIETDPERLAEMTHAEYARTADSKAPK